MGFIASQIIGYLASSLIGDVFKRGGKGEKPDPNNPYNQYNTEITKNIQDVQPLPPDGSLGYDEASNEMASSFMRYDKSDVSDLYSALEDSSKKTLESIYSVKDSVNARIDSLNSNVAVVNSNIQEMTQNAQYNTSMQMEAMGQMANPKGPLSFLASAVSGLLPTVTGIASTLGMLGFGIYKGFDALKSWLTGEGDHTPAPDFDNESIQDYINGILAENEALGKEIESIQAELDRIREERKSGEQTFDKTAEELVSGLNSVLVEYPNPEENYPEDIRTIASTLLNGGQITDEVKSKLSGKIEFTGDNSLDLFNMIDYFKTNVGWDINLESYFTEEDKKNFADQLISYLKIPETQSSAEESLEDKERELKRGEKKAEDAKQQSEVLAAEFVSRFLEEKGFTNADNWMTDFNGDIDSKFSEDEGDFIKRFLPLYRDYQSYLYKKQMNPNLSRSDLTEEELRALEVFSDEENSKAKEDLLKKINESGLSDFVRSLWNNDTLKAEGLMSDSGQLVDNLQLLSYLFGADDKSGKLNSWYRNQTSDYAYDIFSGDLRIIGPDGNLVTDAGEILEIAQAMSADGMEPTPGYKFFSMNNYLGREKATYEDMAEIADQLTQELVDQMNLQLTGEEFDVALSFVQNNLLSDNIDLKNGIRQLLSRPPGIPGGETVSTDGL